ncbi:MAG: phosphoribosyltransferase [Candidatus Eisenbacteria bacterium]|uniref:Phosphoribosyltransferase n=1 Tax=Eiseniibacteriota bacterium TaxID=2212470 RepID=A0A933W0W7_UNCEI|nr:phosphoribosyltransferase [Candidatus Eisenbacteria bacterium]
MRFRDRTHAAQLLAARLKGEYAPPFVICGIPGGGLAIARVLAHELQVPLTVAHVRRLFVPSAPLSSFGALDERGSAVLDPAAVRALKLTLADLEHARTRAWRELHRRSALLRDVMSLRDLATHRHVVLTDEGAATGFTLLAAIRAARRLNAARVSVAVPCASEPALERVVREADDVVCLGGSDGFTSIAGCYKRFEEEAPEHAHRLSGAVPHGTAHGGATRPSLTPR